MSVSRKNVALYTIYGFQQENFGSGFLKVLTTCCLVMFGNKWCQGQKNQRRIFRLDSICALWIFGLLVHSLRCFRVSEITNERDSQCTRTSSFLTVAFPLS